MAVSEFKPKTDGKSESIAIIQIGNSSYSIYDKWLDLAGKYFNIDENSNESINMLKAGLFGYFNEIASNEIKNAVYHRNFLYDEHFLNSASTYNSIYNFAKKYDVDIDNATPSQMSATIVINKNNLINSPLKEDISETNSVYRTYKLTINNDFVFNIQNYNFLLPYPLEIIMKETLINNELDYSITARYSIDNSEFPFMLINSPYIKIWQDVQNPNSVNSEKMIYLLVDLYQIEKEKTEFTITSTDISETLFYPITFKNQIAYFNVFYTEDGERRKINSYFNNTYIPSEEEEFCYYTFVDNNTLEISFSPLSNCFKPEVNSIVEVEYYTTLGSEGNFNYMGRINYKLDSSDSSYEDLGITVFSITNPTGGKDKLDRTAMKTKIIEKITTRDSIITDNDLKVYFSKVNETENVNNGEITFIKKQDDVLKRLYSAFLLLRDNNEKVIPSNTMSSIEIPREDFYEYKDSNGNKHLNLKDSSLFRISKKQDYVPTEEQSFLIKDRFNYEILNNTTTELENNSNHIIENIFGTGNMDDNKDLIYSCPYLLKIDETPVLKGMYYNLYLNKDYNMSYSYINNSFASSIIINSININKSTTTNEIGDTDSIDYTISFHLNASDDVLETDFEVNEETMESPYYQIYGALYRKGTNSAYGFFKFSREEVSNILSNGLNSFYFKGKISSLSEFDKSDKLILKNSLFGNLNDEFSSNYNNVSIDEEVCIKVAIFQKDPNHSLQSNSNEDSNLFSGKNGYTPVLIVETMEDVVLYRNLENMVNSTISKKYYLNNNSELDVITSSRVFTSSNTNIDMILFNNNGTVETYYRKEITTSGSDGDIITDIKYYREQACTNLVNIKETFKVEMIPLIGTKFFTTHQNEVYEIINRYIQVIDDCIDRLENNTSIDLKFYNTFGPSQYYRIKSINEIDGTNYNVEEIKSLDRVDIMLNFDIYVYEATNDFNTRVTEFISEYIEFCNKDKIIPISNLIRLLETNFNEIRYIRFNGLSDEHQEINVLSNNYQIIEGIDTNLDSMTKQEIIEYVPEYINLKKNILKQTTSDNNVTYKFNYLIHITTIT